MKERTFSLINKVRMLIFEKNSELVICILLILSFFIPYSHYSWNYSDALTAQGYSVYLSMFDLAVGKSYNKIIYSAVGGTVNKIPRTIKFESGIFVLLAVPIIMLVFYFMTKGKKTNQSAKIKIVLNLIYLFFYQRCTLRAMFIVEINFIGKLIPLLSLWYFCLSVMEYKEFTFPQKRGINNAE